MHNRYFEYETVTGDTYDMIALDFYKDEKYAIEIIKANPSYREVLIFDSGVTLKIPQIAIQRDETLPPWKS